MMTSIFVITDTAHEDCADCFDQAKSARSTAILTGSVGATQAVGPADEDADHWAQVARTDPAADGFLMQRHPWGHHAERTAA